MSKDISFGSFVKQYVKGDGNCLFRCFSVGLQGNEDVHFMIRRDCVLFNTSEAYWQKTSYALEILAFTKVYQRSVTIYQFVNNEYHELQKILGPDSSQGDPICLLYEPQA